MSNINVIGILLAAGNSSRFGNNKLLHPIAYQHSLTTTLPIAQITAKHFRRACDKAIAVIRPDSDPALETLLKEEGFTLVISAESTQGMGNSIAAGVLATADAKGWIISLADMPYIQPNTYLRIAAQLRDHASIAVPIFEEKRGHPVAFSQKWQKQLLSLKGDTGARSLLMHAQDEISFVPVNDAGILHDIDHKNDVVPY